MSTHDVIGQKPDRVSLADEDGVKQVLVNSILGLWDVVNNLTRLQPSRRDRYRVTIFGSARVQAGTFGYEETKRAAAALAALGCDIITGGWPHPGLPGLLPGLRAALWALGAAPARALAARAQRLGVSAADATTSVGPAAAAPRPLASALAAPLGPMRAPRGAASAPKPRWPSTRVRAGSTARPPAPMAGSSRPSAAAGCAPPTAAVPMRGAGRRPRPARARLAGG